MSFTKRLLDLLFPITCVVCKKNGRHCCPACLDAITKPQKEEQPSPMLDELFFLADITQRSRLWTLLYRLKYDGCREIAPQLAAKMARLLTKPCILVPVPLHPRRMRWREFNQSAEIARAMAKASGSEYQDLLTRKRFTSSQVSRAKAEREKNVRGAFALSGKIKPDRRYLLIDDVHTTGATLNECARALRGGGARYISAAVVAKVR